MDIIFDDSFKFVSNFEKHEDEIPTRISSFGSVILEKNIRLAVAATVVADWEKYKRSTAVDRETILKDILTSPIIIPADKKWFREQVESMSGGGSGGRGGWSSEDGDVQGVLLNETDVAAGQAGADASSSLKLKEAVIARMRMRGRSDQEINDVLVLFMEKVMLPFSETIKILDYCLEESIKARVDFMDIVEFWAYHYKEKRSQGLTKSIVDQAVKLQELNPTINIFNLLKNAAIGNQTEVAKVILIKDPDARLVVNNLISLAQSALPEQAEQVRRNFQFSRDALLNYQEKLKIQKALYDMMKTEETNRNLASYIADTSAIFKGLLTQPIYRAMRDMYYDLQASKMLLNTYSSLIVDMRPVTPRTTPIEEQLSPGEGMFPYQVPSQRISSTKFVALKKNSLVVAQANPVPGSLPTSTNPLTGAQSFVGLAQQPQSQGSLGYPTAPTQTNNAAVQQTNKKQVVDILDKLKEDISKELSSLGAPFAVIAGWIVEAILKLIEAVKKGVSNLMSMVETVFKDVLEKFKNSWQELKKAAVSFFKSMTGGSGNIQNPGTAEAVLGLPDKRQPGASKDFNVRLAQYNQQVTAGGFDAQRWWGGVSVVVAVLVGALGGRGIISALRALSSASDFATIVNLVGPALLFLKNFIIEMWQQAFTIGWGYLAPTSAEYYNPATRQFSAEGVRRLYNNQQVRIALGISNIEDMALSRAQKQRVENMASVRTQTEILQKNMDQNVYLGGKTDIAPGAVPNDLKNKIDVFLKFVKSVQDGAQAEYLILKKAVDRVGSKLDPMQKIQAQNLLSEIRNDMAVLQSLISEYSSSALVMDHIQRKRKLMMKLGPSLKRLQALEGLGISKAALITGSNGILQQLSRVRHEEASALQKLRKEYMEKMQLLDRPDIAQREFAIPTNTTSLRLPLPPLPPTTPTSV
jgi:hypothetical protein